MGNDHQSETKQDKQYECICGKKLTKFTSVSKLYNNNGVYCDKCREKGQPNQIFWHCDKNNIHKNGFDICDKCIATYDVLQFQKEAKSTSSQPIITKSTSSQPIITSNKQNQQQFDDMKDEYLKCDPQSFQSNSLHLLQSHDYNMQSTKCNLSECKHLRRTIRILKRYTTSIKKKEPKNNDEKVYYPNLDETKSNVPVATKRKSKQKSKTRMSREDAMKRAREEAMKMSKDVANTVLPNLEEESKKNAQEKMRQKVQIYALSTQLTSTPNAVMTQFVANRSKKVQQLKLMAKNRNKKLKHLNSMQVQITNTDYSSVESQVITNLHGDGYTHTDLLNDYHHLLEFHPAEFEQIYNIISHDKNCGDCQLFDCLLFRRNNRNRSKLQINDKKLREMYADMNDEYGIVDQQLLDRIHCYYHHTFDTGYKFTQKEIQNIMNECDEKKQGVAYIDELNKSKRKKYQRMAMTDISKFTTHCDEKEVMYDVGVRYFYWAYYKSQKLATSFIDSAAHMYVSNEMAANHGYRLEDWYIAPLVPNIKFESLNNAIYAISKFQWDEVVENAKEHLKSDHFKQTICRHPHSECFYGIKSETPIEMDHLVAMTIYCNYDFFQRKFSETYRKIPMDETDDSLRRRHAHYAHLGRLLRECVECFGNDIGYLDFIDLKLYHGINQKVHFASSVICFKGPVSTTTDYSVAVNFATTHGMILELNLGIDCAYLPDLDHRGMAMVEMFYISTYPHEQERFFIGGFCIFGITNIISVPDRSDYSLYTYALCKLFHCIGNYGLSYSEQNMLREYKEKIINQLCFRMLSHEMHSLYPNQQNYVKFESFPQYAKELMHRHCAGMTQLRFFNIDDNAIQRMVRNLFFYDYGWINLDKLMTIFPSVMHIEFKCQVNDQFMEIESMYLSIVSYLQNNPDSPLEKITIQIPRTSESIEKATRICKKFELKFNTQKYTIVVLRMYVIFIEIRKDLDEWEKHLQTVYDRKLTAKFNQH